MARQLTTASASSVATISPSGALMGKSGRGPYQSPRPQRSALAWNILWLYGLQGLNYVAPLVLLPYLVRVLGVERYGLVVVSQSIAQYFIIATDYGFNFSATRAITTNRNDRMAISRIFWTVISVKAFLLALGALVMAAMLLWIPRFHAESAIYGVAYLSVIGNAIFPQWLFQGMESMRSISIISGSAKVAAGLCIILFVHHPEDALLAAILLSSGLLAAGLVGVFVGIQRYAGAFVRPERSGLLAAIRDGRHLFLTTASISLFTNTNTLLVGLIAGNAQAGYFSLADKLARATTGVMIGPVIQAAYPHTIRLIAESKHAALAFLRRTIGYAGVLAALTGVGIFLLARPIARIAFGGHALEVLLLVKCAAMFPFLATLNGILGTLVLIPFGCDRPQSQLVLAAAAVNAILGFVLISAGGAVGGVIAMVLIEILLVGGNLIVLSREKIDLLQRSA